MEKIVELEKNKFYTIRSKKNSLVFWNNIDRDFKLSKEDMEIEESTELEKEYWCIKMDKMDKKNKKNKFCGVSLCEIDEFKKSKEKDL